MLIRLCRVGKRPKSRKRGFNNMSKSDSKTIILFKNFKRRKLTSNNNSLNSIKQSKVSGIGSSSLTLTWDR